MTLGRHVCDNGPVGRAFVVDLRVFVFDSRFKSDDAVTPGRRVCENGLCRQSIGCGTWFFGL